MLNPRTLMFDEPSISYNVSHYTTILILPHITRLDLCYLEFLKLEGDEEQTCKTSSRTSKLQWTPPRCDTNSEYPNANDKACSAHIDKIIRIDYTSHNRYSQRNVGRTLIHRTFCLELDPNACPLLDLCTRFVNFFPLAVHAQR